MTSPRPPPIPTTPAPSQPLSPYETILRMSTPITTNQQHTPSMGDSGGSGATLISSGTSIPLIPLPTSLRFLTHSYSCPPTVTAVPSSPISPTTTSSQGSSGTPTRTHTPTAPAGPTTTNSTVRGNYSPAPIGPATYHASSTIGHHQHHHSHRTRRPITPVFDFAFASHHHSQEPQPLRPHQRSCWCQRCQRPVNTATRTKQVSWATSSEQPSSMGQAPSIQLGHKGSAFKSSGKVDDARCHVDSKYEPLSLTFSADAECPTSFSNVQPVALQYHTTIEADLAALSSVPGRITVRPYESSAIVTEMEQIEEDQDELILSPHYHISSNVGPNDLSILSTSGSLKYDTLAPVYRTLISELAAISTHPALTPFVHSLAAIACMVPSQVHTMRAEMQYQAKQVKIRAAMVETMIERVMYAYQEGATYASNEPTNNTVFLDANLSAPPLTRAITTLFNQFRDQNFNIDDLSEALSSSLPSQPTMSTLPLPIVQHISLKSAVQAGVILLSTIQQYDPHALAQVLGVTREGLLELRSPSTLCNLPRGLGQHGLHYSTLVTLTPIFELFGRILHTIPAHVPGGNPAPIPQLLNSPFSNVFSAIALNNLQPNHMPRGVVPPSLKRFALPPPTGPSTVSSSTVSSQSPPLTLQLLRAQCIEVSLLWSLTRGHFNELMLWISYILQTDCKDINGSSKMMSTQMPGFPTYDVIPFQKLLGLYQHDPDEEEYQREQDMRNLVHQIYTPQRKLEQFQYQQVLNEFLHTRRRQIHGADKHGKLSPRQVLKPLDRVELKKARRLKHQQKQKNASERKEEEKDEEEKEEEKDVMNSPKTYEPDTIPINYLDEPDDDWDDHYIVPPTALPSPTNVHAIDCGCVQSLHGLIFLHHLFSLANDCSQHERKEHMLVHDMLKRLYDQQARANEFRRIRRDSSASLNVNTPGSIGTQPTHFQILPHLILREFDLVAPASAQDLLLPTRRLPTPVFCMFIMAHLDRLSAKNAQLCQPDFPTRSRTKQVEVTNQTNPKSPTVKKTRKGSKKPSTRIRSKGKSSSSSSTSASSSSTSTSDHSLPTMDPLTFCCNDDTFAVLMKVIELLSPMYITVPNVQQPFTPPTPGTLPLSDYYSYMYTLLATLRLLGRHLCAIQATLTDKDSVTTARKYLSPTLADRLRMLLWKLFKSHPSSFGSPTLLLIQNVELIRSTIRSTIQVILSDNFEVLYSGDVAMQRTVVLHSIGDDSHEMVTKSVGRSNRLLIVPDIIDMWNQEEAEQRMATKSVTPVTPATSLFPAMLCSFLSAKSSSFLPNVNSLVQALLPRDIILSPLWEPFVTLLCRHATPIELAVMSGAPIIPATSSKASASDIPPPPASMDERQTSDLDASLDDHLAEDISMDLDRPFRNPFIPLTDSTPSAIHHHATLLKTQQLRAQHVIKRMFRLLQRSSKEIKKQSQPPPPPTPLPQTPQTPNSASSTASATFPTPTASGRATPWIDLSLVDGSKATFDLFNRCISSTSTLKGPSSLSVPVGGKSAEVPVPKLDISGAPWFDSLLTFLATFQGLLLHSTCQTLKLHQRLAIEQTKVETEQRKQQRAKQAPLQRVPSTQSIMVGVQSGGSPQKERPTSTVSASSTASTSNSTSSNNSPQVASSSTLLAHQLNSQLEITKRYILDLLHLFEDTTEDNSLFYFVRSNAGKSYEFSPFSFVLLHNIVQPLFLALLHLSHLDGVPLIVSILPTLHRVFVRFHTAWLQTIAFVRRDMTEILPQRVRDGVSKPVGIGIGGRESEPTSTIWLSSVFFPTFSHLLGSLSRQCFFVLAPLEKRVFDQFDPLIVEETKGERDRYEQYRLNERHKRSEDEAALMETRIEEWTDQTKLLAGGLTHMSMLPPPNVADPFPQSLRQLQRLLQDGTNRTDPICVSFQQKYRELLPWSNEITLSSTLVLPSEEDSFLQQYFNHSPNLAWFTELLQSSSSSQPNAKLPPRGPSAPYPHMTLLELSRKASQLYFCVLVKHTRRLDLCVREQRMRVAREKILQALQSSFKDLDMVPNSMMPPPPDPAPTKLVSLYTKSLEMNSVFVHCTRTGGDINDLYELIRSRASFLCFECEPFDEARISAIMTSCRDYTLRMEDNRRTSRSNTVTSQGSTRSTTPTGAILSGGTYTPIASPTPSHRQNSSIATTSPAGTQFAPFSYSMPVQRSAPYLNGSAAVSSSSANTNNGQQQANQQQQPQQQQQQQQQPQHPVRTPTASELARTAASTKRKRLRYLIRKLRNVFGALIRMKYLLHTRKLFSTVPIISPLLNINYNIADPNRNSLLSITFKHLETEVQIIQSTYVFLTQDYDQLIANKKKQMGIHDDPSVVQQKGLYNRLFLLQLKARMIEQYTRTLWRMFGLHYFDHLSTYLIDSSIEDPASEWHASKVRKLWVGPTESIEAAFANPAAQLIYNTPRTMLNYTLLHDVLMHLRTSTSGCSFVSSPSISPNCIPICIQQFSTFFHMVYRATHLLRPSHPMYNQLNIQILMLLNYLPANGENIQHVPITSGKPKKKQLSTPSPLIDTTSPAPDPSPSLDDSLTFVATSGVGGEWINWRVVSKKLEWWIQTPNLSSCTDPHTWHAAIGGASSHAASWELRSCSWILYRLIAYRSTEIYARLNLSDIAATKKSAETSSTAVLMGDVHPSKQIVIDVLRFIHQQLQISQARRREYRQALHEMEEASAQIDKQATTIDRTKVPRGFFVCRSCFFINGNLRATTCVACGISTSLTVRPITDSILLSTHGSDEPPDGKDPLLSCVTTHIRHDAYEPFNPLNYLPEEELTGQPLRPKFERYHHQYQQLTQYIHQMLWLLLRMVQTHPCITDKCLTQVAPLTQDNSTSEEGIVDGISNDWIGMILEYLQDQDEPLLPPSASTATSSSYTPLRMVDSDAWVTRILSYRLLRFLVPAISPIALDRSLQRTSLLTANNLPQLLNDILETVGRTKYELKTPIVANLTHPDESHAAVLPTRRLQKIRVIMSCVSFLQTLIHATTVHTTKTKLNSDTNLADIPFEEVIIAPTDISSDLMFWQQYICHHLRLLVKTEPEAITLTPFGHSPNEDLPISPVTLTPPAPILPLDQTVNAVCKNSILAPLNDETITLLIRLLGIFVVVGVSIESTTSATDPTIRTLIERVQHKLASIPEPPASTADSDHSDPLTNQSSSPSTSSGSSGRRISTSFIPRRSPLTSVRMIPNVAETNSTTSTSASSVTNSLHPLDGLHDPLLTELTRRPGDSNSGPDLSSTIFQVM